MKPIQYSSLTAFLEHYKALKSSSDPAPEEISIRSEMEKLIDSAGPGARALLETEAVLSATGADLRRRQRAERELRRELLVRGVLTG
ncbi:MAG: hypothetical protein ACHQZS_03395 [Candidatus Binatales bacterium]